MTLTNAIKKAFKKTCQFPERDGQFYNFTYKGYSVSFAQNGRYDEATNFYTRKLSHEDDLNTDYFAGTFHDNITQAFDFVDRMTKN